MELLCLVGNSLMSSDQVGSLNPFEQNQKVVVKIEAPHRLDSRRRTSQESQSTLREKVVTHSSSENFKKRQAETQAFVLAHLMIYPFG